jgi:hypothetical protein
MAIGILRDPFERPSESIVHRGRPAAIRRAPALAVLGDPPRFSTIRRSEGSSWPVQVAAGLVGFLVMVLPDSRSSAIAGNRPTSGPDQAVSA